MSSVPKVWAASSTAQRKPDVGNGIDQKRLGRRRAGRRSMGPMGDQQDEQMPITSQHMKVISRFRLITSAIIAAVNRPITAKKRA